VTIRKTFTTPFQQHRDRIGQRFEIVRKITEPDENFDEESLPMYRIRFEDGFETDAFPVEVETTFEVVLKEREMTSVTITADRTSVKIPSKRPIEIREKVIALVKKIEDEVRAKYPDSMRGSFDPNFTRLELWNNTRTEKITFEMES
jgi:hypothetical protein